MLQLGHMAVAYADLLRTTLNANGVDGDGLLSDYRLSADAFIAPDVRISIPRFMRMGHEAITRLQQPDLGIALGDRLHTGHLGLVGAMMLTSPNLLSALRAMVRYEPLLSYSYRGQSQLIIEGEQARLVFYSIAPYNAYNRFIVDMVLVGWISLLEQLLSAPLAWVELSLEYQEPEGQGHLFRWPAAFSQGENSIRFPSRLLHTPLPWQQATSHQQFKGLAEAQLQSLFLRPGYRERVAQAIGPLLSKPPVTLGKVAERMGIAPWTLRRRLQQEQVGFGDVLQQTRRTLACAYLQDTQYSVKEISYLLGYKTPEAFQQAFARWFSVAPGRWRRAHGATVGHA